MAACARSETLCAGFLAPFRLEEKPLALCILPSPEEISRLRFRISAFQVRRRFLFGPQSGFWFPCCCQRLAVGNLLWAQFFFGCKEALLIKLQIVLGGKPEPHLGLNRIARKLFSTL